MVYLARNPWNSVSYCGSVFSFKATLNRVNESAHAIREQHIHFLWFYDRGYFTFTKRAMQKRLSFAIRSSPVIWRARLDSRTTRCACAISGAGCAHRTTNARDPTCLADRTHDVTSLLTTRDAHLVDT